MGRLRLKLQLSLLALSAAKSPTEFESMVLQRCARVCPTFNETRIEKNGAEAPFCHGAQRIDQ